LIVALALAVPTGFNEARAQEADSAATAGAGLQVDRSARVDRSAQVDRVQALPAEAVPPESAARPESLQVRYPDRPPYQLVVRDYGSPVYGVGYLPSGARSVHGVGIGLIASWPLMDDRTWQQVNGLGVSVIGGGFLATILLGPLTPLLAFDFITGRRHDGCRPVDRGAFPGGFAVNGLLVSGGGAITRQVNGVSLSPYAGMAERMNGVLVSPLMTVTGTHKGLVVGGFTFATCAHGLTVGAVTTASGLSGVQIGVFNQTAETRGLQIGIYNYSTDLRGIQIGLLNRSSKRILPFINWGF
jgi:hypothetical protein